MSYYNILQPLLFSLPEEIAHNLVIQALKYGLVPQQFEVPSSKLKTKLFGLNFKNPVGLAAGFDKNGSCIKPLIKQGLGFVEVGTATPLPQPGNPKPRLFRLKEDKAIINKMGFNNKGIDRLSRNIFLNQTSGIVGANIGKNKDSENAINDYLIGLEKIFSVADYITINISSPNTPGLRDLQGKEQLDDLLKNINEKREELSVKFRQNTPILLKIAPDMDEKSLGQIIESVFDHNIDGMIISNTTIGQRDNLKSKNADKDGGLSGKPLFQPSTEMLKTAYKISEGKIPLIGVGGISSGEEAYEKIKSGASLVQLYTALIYNGFDLITEINMTLLKLLKRDGLSNISEAVGADTQ
jgi:dihydroorotate dehydrogenase